LKIAYVITAHKNPLQLRRMLDAIYWPGNTYVIHVDVKAPREVHDVARDFAASHTLSAVIPSDNIIWGSWRLALVQTQAIAKALELSKDWAYCFNLSGQDYPLKSQPELAQILAQGEIDKSYMEVLRFKEASENPKKRLEHWWAPWRGQMKKLWRRRWPSFEVFWGSNQWVLTREACEFIAHSKLSKQMHKTFRFSLCADELIFQNILMHGPLREKVITQPMRKVVWTGGWHPKVFTIEDRDELLNAKEWFARKFDETVDLHIMDALDEALKQRQIP
jgi:hypothetical protein